MDFLRYVFDYFRGRNTKRFDESKWIPSQNDTDPDIGGGEARDEVDFEISSDFINNIFGGNKSSNDEEIFGLERNSHFFGGITNLFKMVIHFEEMMNEMDRQSNGQIGFQNFPEINFENMRGILGESEKTLTGERLRNYYLNGNSEGADQADNQIVLFDDKDSNHFWKAEDNEKSPFTIVPHFQSESRFVTTKIGPDGIAEITTVVRDAAGNEEKTVRKVKLFK